MGNFQRRIMGIGRIEISGVILLSLLVSSSQGISCTAILQSLDCLPAFSHAPASLTKCYCSSLCPDIESLRQNCPSGQLQTDPCGVCLQCAPGFGERCGGYANEAGECAGGLGCLIKYRPGVESEHNSTGTCVTEQGAECRDVRSGVSCRPGQLGVPSEFVFCPAPPAQGCGNTNSVTGSSADKPGPGFLFSGSQSSSSNGAKGEGSRRAGSGIRDTLQTIVSQGQGVVPLLSQTGVPQAVHDIIGRR